MSRKFVLRSLSLFVMFMLTFSLVSTVLADSGDPTSINATVNGQDVTVSGQWTWEDASCNDSSVKIVGWAVAWGEPGYTGNPVPKGGGGNYYMGEAGTYPTTQGNHVFTDGQLCGSFPGPWGPLTHHYSAPGTYQICVIIYDLRANDIGDTGSHSDVAGGVDRNKDNSVEENFTEVENCEPGTVIIPSTPTLETRTRINAGADPAPASGVALGTTVTDRATLGETGNNGPVTGDVDFFVCGPTAAAANCTVGTSAGANKTISNGVANSNGVTLDLSGWYCFRAEYDSNTEHYNDTSHTNDTTECVFAKPTITVEKTANPTSIAEPGGNITFTVAVTNHGGPNGVVAVDDLSLSDDKFGDVTTGTSTCVTAGTIIAAGATYTCTFTRPVTGNAGFVHVNNLTASAHDSQGNVSTDTDDATVTITNVAPIIATLKVANPTTLPEPGGNVTYTVTVTNSSTVDPETITSLTDDKFGVLAGDADCHVGTVLAIGASCSFDFVGLVSGNAGFVHTNIATACAVDDDGSPAACDGDDAVVTITNVASSILVDKSATPTTIAEPGGTITFTVVVTNTSAVDALTISSLNDNVYGALTGDADCQVGTVLAAAGGTCTFDFTGPVSGNAGSTHTDTVTVCAADDDAGADPCDDDSATVTINDVAPIITTIKAANPTSLPEPGGNVTFTVTVSNISQADTVMITSLNDSVFGPLVGDADCQVGTTIAKGLSCTFDFVGAVSGNAGFVHTNIATVCSVDDDGTPACDDDDAVVTITNVASTLTVTKSATPTSIAEPGGTITFTVLVQNTSAADVLTISSLNDNVYGALTGDADCQVGTVLPIGGSCTFDFTGPVSGNAGSTHTDIVTVCAADDDAGADPCDDDDAVVTITNLDSTLEVTKTASPTHVAEPGGNVTFTVSVTNTSTVDALTITSLNDNVYGALTGDADCQVGTVLAPSAWCTFTFVGPVSGNAGSSHTDIVTVCADDDDEGTACDDDDETVTVDDVEPTLTVTKTANDNSVSVGDPVTFTVVVTNTSVEPVTIASLNDSIYGNLATRPGSTCDTLIGTTLGIGASTSCTFAAIATVSETNVVTVCIADDDENEQCETDDEHVDVLNPQIRIAKVADAEGVVAGQPIGFRIILFNAGIGNASGVKLTDLLPVVAGLNWAIAPSGVGQAWGDQGTSCAIAAGTLTCGGAAGVNVPGSLSLDNSFFTVHVISTTTAATSANSPVENEACVESSNSGPQVCAQADVDVFALTLEKDNDAPEIELPDGTTIKSQNEGKLVKYTLKYDVGATTVHDVDLTDVLPAGITFQAIPAPTSTNPQLTFVSAVGQTLTWHADFLNVDGEVSYYAKVDVGTNKLTQPRVNEAVIVSDETPEDTADSQVFVPAPPHVETHLITGPPTDVLPTQGESGPGSSMMVILAVLGLLVIAVSFVTPAPAAVRRRNNRQR